MEKTFVKSHEVDDQKNWWGVKCQSPESIVVAKAGKISQKFLGAHVSANGGIHNAVKNAADIGCRSFALFLRNQRTWNAKPLDPNVAQLFIAAIQEYGYRSDMILPHGSYLLNAGSPNPENLRKTREVLVDEVKRCKALGIRMYNFHPGSAVKKISADQCIKTIAETVNYVIQRTSDVILLIETMASQGTTIGGKFGELRDIIHLVEDKSRIGVCLDTCHVFASGYDISNKEGYDNTMNEFGDIIGWQYLKAVHLNDSKGDCDSHLDRHETIGRGKIGITGFSLLMNDRRFDGIPMVLETPEGRYDEEMVKL